MGCLTALYFYEFAFRDTVISRNSFITWLEKDLGTVIFL
jgi:hypothetical protein